MQTTKIVLWLRVENNNKFIRRKKKVRQGIESFCLSQYKMKKLAKSCEYELTFTYSTDDDLEKQIYDLANEMVNQADLDYCFIEADFREIGTERRW